LGQLAQREMAITGPMVINSLMRGLGFSLFAGLIIAFLGPFGTFEKLPILWRLGFWISAIVGGFLFHMPIYWLARFFTQSKGWPIWVAIVGSAIIAALPTTVLVNGIAISLLNSVTTDSILTLYPMVLALSLPLQVIGHLTAFRGEPDVNVPIISDVPMPISEPITPTLPPSAKQTQTTSPFFARLPGRLGKDLLCLQMEDHYVRAFTAIGSELILMRMADAARELENYDGLVVHRSFWVARNAVAGWTRDGKNLTLRLSNNKNIPVARDRQPRVKAAGWLVGAGD
jgi:LytTr DNA-binding domain